jgi:hypothetical protein
VWIRWLSRFSFRGRGLVSIIGSRVIEVGVIGIN